MSHFFSETETESVRKERVRNIIKNNDTKDEEEEEEIQIERQATEILEVPSNDLELYFVEVYTGNKSFAGLSFPLFYDSEKRNEQKGFHSAVWRQRYDRYYAIACNQQR